ncbi:alpha/beta hydrolase [Primorskyibacter aestuariivivens]|uniref:alpha/beta fold hydrolase n=1 Tax=Primorskyibacter aestuariivivens TaxID=1888912 RepID=UPI002300F331|nr:alpha/beta hydrolase [Primorskyibacter aestuariivivens]MDA7427304.1 alpha/beta hydrolase [Primorskyibacter aestuariivivens]
MSAPRLLMLHGWTMRGAAFGPLIDRLEGIDCLAPDLPGHGVPGAGLDDCVALIEEQSRGRDIVLLGWSMGAAVAWRYIREFGAGRLAGLITVDMAPKLCVTPDWPHGLIGQDAARLAATTAEIHTDWPAAAQKIATTMFASRDGSPQMMRAAALRQVLDNDPSIMARYWDEMVAMDLRDVMPAISCPTLVAHGGQSRVYPGSGADWLAGAIPGAERVCFKASGHSPHLEEPERFAEVVRAFWTRCTG